MSTESKKFKGSASSILFLLLSLTIFIIGCGGGGSGSSLSALDQSIINRLLAINPQGLPAFILPDSNAYGLIPEDPNNPITPEKVALGQLLFHETGLMKIPSQAQGMETASCASCHHAAAGFQANRFQGVGEGGLNFGAAGEARRLDPTYLPAQIDTQPIRTPSAMNIAYQPNVLWNGQFGATHANVGTQAQWTVGSPKERNFLGFEGTETQAIAGLGVHRLFMTKQIADEFGYTPLFDAAFPSTPLDNRYSVINAGLAIAAYERTILSNQSKWQRWLRGDFIAMTESQKQGADLFFGKADCFKCHNGPALSEQNFRAIGLKDLWQHPGANNSNPALPENRGRGGFTLNPNDDFKFKTPQIYNLKDSPHYGHGASFSSVRELIQYKNRAIPENSAVPINRLDPLFRPLNLSDSEIDAITDFVLNALHDPNLHRYTPSVVLSGNAFPNNDQESQ